MKIFFAVVVILTNISFSQEEVREVNDYFIVLYTTGENWDTTKQAYEQSYFKDHSSHLAELRKNKNIIIGGRYSDTGMIILLAKDETEAHDLITKDKAIENKTFSAEIFPFNPFYKGCVE